MRSNPSHIYFIRKCFETLKYLIYCLEKLKQMNVAATSVEIRSPELTAVDILPHDRRFDPPNPSHHARYRCIR